jgi:prephenate dehydrogenase
MINTKFNSILIIGIGLIGSSLARAIKENDLAKNIYGLDNNPNNLKKCNELKLLSRGENSLDGFSEEFDMIII